MKINYILLLMLFVCINTASVAASSTDTIPKPPSTAPKPSLIPLVLGVVTQKADTTAIMRNGGAFAGDVVKIKISHPQEFLESKPQDKSKLILFIDGMPFSGVNSTYFDQYSKTDIKNKTFALPDTITIPFVLIRDVNSRTTWDYFYRVSDWSARRITVQASVGWEGMFPLALAPKADNRFTIVYFHDLVLYVFAGFYALFIAFFIYIAFTTNVLRDFPRDATQKGISPYSLAQTQLAFWTVLIVGGFIYTVVLTDIAGSINASVLMLLGISISTNGVASYIDYFKKVTPTITETPKAHSSFIKDIFSDGETYSVQRVQTVVWNLVLGIYYVYYTVDNKTMPVFPDVLLYLAGVSSIAYVASKRTENVVTTTT